MPEKMMITLPKESYGEIKLRLSAAKFSGEDVAEFSQMMLEAAEKRHRIFQNRFWNLMRQVISDLGENKRYRFDEEAMLVREIGKDDKDTGISFEVPKSAYREALIWLEKSNIVESTKTAIASLVSDMVLESQYRASELHAALGYWAPESLSGSWLLDPERMVLIKEDTSLNVTEQEDTEKAQEI